MPDAVSKSSLTTLHVRHDGCLPYAQAWALQKILHAQRCANKIPDTLILCEHPPVFTTGRQDVASDWLLPQADIRAKGIDIESTNRGGRITYHGPGQLVGYFICDLQARRQGVVDFVHWIESSLIEILAAEGIQAERDSEFPGVWVAGHKLAAIGLNVQRHVTLHGFALNITTDMTPYTYVIPCGIADKGITRLQDLQPERQWDLASFTQKLAAYFDSRAAKVG